MRVEDGFQPIPYPTLHPYTDDPVLPNLLKRLIPASCRAEIESDLTRFGDDITGYIRALSPLVHPPTLMQYDQWGRRVDQLNTSEGWRRLKDIAIREGLVAIAHERQYREYSRVYSFAKISLFASDAHTIMCPMSMTDGAARVLELFGTENMKREIHSRLISRDPSVAITSGQWMTERPGGSDVSQTETTAVPLSDSSRSTPLGTAYSIDGFKWFSSATDSQVAVALARTGPLSLGSRSLSLFLIPLRNPIDGISSTSNGILVHRLKNKFGTHSLPTAELSLTNTTGYLLGPLNHGVRSISPVLNITRMHSAVGVLSSLGRSFAIACGYATVRRISVPELGSRILKDVPLHVASLASVAVTYHALTHLTFGAVMLLGKAECGVANEEEKMLLRLMTPVTKAYVAEKAISAMEQCMQCLGGQGYMEENVIGRLIRDCTVDRIWEGTLNVLSLDLIRASRGDESVAHFVQWGNGILASVSPTLAANATLQTSLRSLQQSFETVVQALSKKSLSPLAPVPILFLFAHVTAGLYVLEHVIWGDKNRSTYTGLHRDVEVFIRWAEGLEAARTEVEKVIVLAEGSDREVKNLELVYGNDRRAERAKL